MSHFIDHVVCVYKVFVLLRHHKGAAQGEILFCKVRAYHGKQGKSWNLIDGPAKSLKIKFMLDRLYTADVKARTLSDKDYSN